MINSSLLKSWRQCLQPMNPLAPQRGLGPQEPLPIPCWNCWLAWSCPGLLFIARAALSSCLQQPRQVPRTAFTATRRHNPAKCRGPAGRQRTLRLVPWMLNQDGTIVRNSRFRWPHGLQGTSSSSVPTGSKHWDYFGRRSSCPKPVVEDAPFEANWTVRVVWSPELHWLQNTAEGGKRTDGNDSGHHDQQWPRKISFWQKCILPWGSAWKYLDKKSHVCPALKLQHINRALTKCLSTE